MTETAGGSGTGSPHTRSATALWIGAGILFALYPIVRPYSTETGSDGAAAFARNTWVIAHLCAVAGFIALTLALRVLEHTLAGTPGARTASAAVVLTWIGVALTLTYYGAETFALHALGTRAANTADPAAMTLVDPVRNGTVQITVFGIGLLLILGGGIASALAIARSSRLPRWSGIPLAIGLALFLPQFFGNPAVRIAHGALMLVGCLTVAWAMTRRYGPRPHQ